MRVSNVHHETAVQNLFNVQEMEPDLYAKLTNRLEGIDTATKMGKADFFVHELPFMFKDWREYRDYLLENLIDKPEWKEKLKKIFTYHDRIIGEEMGVRKYKAHVQSILAHDWEGIKLTNFINNYDSRDARRAHKRRSNALNATTANKPA